MNQPEEYQDIALLREGDRKAFERIYNRYWPKVSGFTRLYLTDPREREEIVQQVFVKLWKIRGRLDAGRSLDGFLFVMTRNLIFSGKVRKMNEAAYKEAVRHNGIPSTDVEAQILADDLQHYVDQLVALLPPRQRQTFLLSRKNHLSTKEIATVLGISERGVERNIYLALKFIRENLPAFLLFIGL